MAPYSSILAWKIPWVEEPGGLQSVGLRRVGLEKEMAKIMGGTWLHQSFSCGNSGSLKSFSTLKVKIKNQVIYYY